MTNTASVLLTAAQAAMHSPRAGERELAARYETGIRRLIAEFEGADGMPYEKEYPALNGEKQQRERGTAKQTPTAARTWRHGANAPRTNK